MQWGRFFSEQSEKNRPHCINAPRITIGDFFPYQSSTVQAIDTGAVQAGPTLLESAQPAIKRKTRVAGNVSGNTNTRYVAVVTGLR